MAEMPGLRPRGTFGMMADRWQAACRPSRPGVLRSMNEDAQPIFAIDIMTVRRFMFRSTLVAFTATLIFTTAATQAVEPFATDGCSLFPDQSLVSNTDWCSCCLRHDLAYWRGGTEDERLKADQDLKRCVLAASGSAQLAELMYAGVRTGGGPYYFTPYRWGYGWPYGRLYQPFSPDEESEVATARAQYLSANPTLACPHETAPTPTATPPTL